MAVWAIPFPNIDPVAIELGPLAVKWYGLAYLAGLVLGWLYIRKLVSTPQLWAGGNAPFGLERVDDLLLYMTLGVVIGGRLGFVLFYEPGYYLTHLLEIPAVWKGGMAFHGALLGCGVAIWLFARMNGFVPWSVMDVCAAAVPLGLLFGRIANFINGELFGRPTSVAWGMVFPAARFEHPAIEPTPRHPSQLYEAALEGLVLFLVLRWLTHRKDGLGSPGLTVGVFLTGYGLVRSFAELFRQPDTTHALTTGILTPGIAYSLPMIALGIYFIARAKRRVASAA